MRSQATPVNTAVALSWRLRFYLERCAVHELRLTTRLLRRSHAELVDPAGVVGVPGDQSVWKGKVGGAKVVSAGWDLFADRPEKPGERVETIVIMLAPPLT